MSEEQEQVEEGDEENPQFDSKGNRLDYEASAYARPRTKGTFKNGNPLDDRTSGHS